MATTLGLFPDVDTYTVACLSRRPEVPMALLVDGGKETILTNCCLNTRAAESELNPNPIPLPLLQWKSSNASRSGRREPLGI